MFWVKLNFIEIYGAEKDEIFGDMEYHSGNRVVIILKGELLFYSLLFFCVQI